MARKRGRPPKTRPDAAAPVAGEDALARCEARYREMLAFRERRYNEMFVRRYEEGFSAGLAEAFAIIKSAHADEQRRLQEKYPDLSPRADRPKAAPPKPEPESGAGGANAKG